jgi:4a-hydroxytetrahydrobiopterin dehydratase
MAELLDTQQVNEWLDNHPHWRRQGESIVREIEADSFLTGIDLVGRVAEPAEAADHHPDIDIRWRTLTFTLSTHSAGGITRADLDLADTIDSLT